ncbi:uncharacterized protein F4822DRAFT_401113 [Hypoxylon trugodes]|uniref:uncharacterized protein n=1 Tax=Hypoxylon trugodes TaxID=326681 RepID=UPI00219306AB|nr:uncharacterized protein F4822DRAFT_401113 [Hypoxylon trugodes]KAI1390180.1 hypothetical protein F4822DRAFT_401113 [Hypoxylon trugodes]
MPSEPSTSGIVTDENSGERQIPESVRADGTTRKAIKIRPGYRPPEDVELYKNRTAESFRNRGKGGVIGAEGLKEQKPQETLSASSNKNAKRREARKKAAKSNQDPAAAGDEAPKETNTTKTEEAIDPEVEKEKKARNLKKKLKQAKDLKSKKDGGESLLPEQIAKVIKINELVRELEALGFDSEGEPKSNSAEAAKEG